MIRIDSHHHVHTDWVVYRALKPLAKQYGFTSMRLSATLHKVGLPMRVYKYLLNRDIRANFGTTDEFDGFYPSVVTAAKSGRSVELMVHPLYSSSGELLDSSSPYENLISTLTLDLNL